MNKHLLILGIAVLLLTVGLSGCFDNKKILSDGTVITGDIDKVEIVSYSVRTTWTTGDLATGVESHSKPGFCHNLTGYNVHGRLYIINVTIKNIAGYKLEYIAVTITYYDKQGNEIGLGLLNKKTTYNLPNTYTRNLTFDWSEYDEKNLYGQLYEGYFNQADHIGIHVTTEIYG